MIKESKLIGTKLSMPYGWHEFKVGDLFDVSGTHGFDKGDIVLSSHGTEFIGRTETNNGVQGFYDDPFVAPNEANTISISQIGAQTAQYRRNQWYASQNLFKLIPKFEMHERHALFLIGFINRGLSIYSGYSHFPKVVDIADMQLLLPVTQDEQPDYGWMSSYIRELENQRIRELENQRIRELDTHLQVTGLDDTILTDNEVQILEQWRQHEKFGGALLMKHFLVGDLFDCISIPQIPKYVDLQKGDIPYVTQTEVNNGVKQYIKPTDDLQLNDEKGIVLGVDTQVVYYQEKPFYANKMIQLVFKHDATKLHYLFAMSLLKAQFRKYNYNNKLSLSRLKDTELELPVTADGTPAYEFMETFIRAQEKLVMQNLAEFRQRQIDTTRQII